MAFFEFNVALSGLYAAQKGLQVTGNNISNTNTEGYSRQVLTQKASRPIAGIGVGMTGTGAEITSVNRKRDAYLDQKLWKQNGALGEYNIKVTQNSIIESTFGSTTDKTGFTKVFNNVFKAIDDLSKNPSSPDFKTQVKEHLISFTEYYNNISGSLLEYRDDLNTQLRSTVQKINNLAHQIGSLNEQIFQAEVYGREASSLRDERDLCIDQLSKLINVSVDEREVFVNDRLVTDGSGNALTKTTVSIAGQVLVDDSHVNILVLNAKGVEEKEIDALVEDLKVLYDKRKAGTITDAERITEAEIEKKLRDYRGVSVDHDTYSVKINRYGKSCDLLSLDGGTIKMKSSLTEIVGEDERMYNIEWANGLSFDETDVNMTGELKGIIDMRDGQGTEIRNADGSSSIVTTGRVTYAGIPYYLDKLDHYIQVFAKALNEEYSKDKEGNIEIAPGVSYTSGGNTYQIAGIAIGEDADGHKTLEKAYYYDGDIKKEVPAADLAAIKDDVLNNYIPKYQLFSYTTGDAAGSVNDGSGIRGGDYSNMRATNFSISKEILDDISNMRTSYEADDKSDGTLWSKVLALKDDDSMFRQGDPKDYMSSIFTTLGINTEQSIMYESTQNAVTQNIINQRLSVSQVDISEEFTYLIQYQQAYQAAAKMMNTIDGIYETTIFKLGNF